MELSKDQMKKEELPEIRVIMIGKTGAGKSYLGNALLGRKEFISSVTAASVTTYCAFGKQEITSRSRKYILKVIDTPGLKDNRFTEDETCGEMVKSLSLSLPGPHFFVIVVQIGRFIKEDLDVVDLLKEEFGNELMNFALVVFTHGFKLYDMSIDDYLKTAPPTLQKVVKECQNRYAVIYDERDKNFQKSVQNIIDLIVSSAELRYYTNDMLKQADGNKQKIIAKLEEDKNREINALKEKLKEKLEELERREGEKCSKEVKRKLKVEKQTMEGELKITETTSSTEKYDAQVVSNNSVASETFKGAILKAVSGLVTIGVGILNRNKDAVDLGVIIATKGWSDDI